MEPFNISMNLFCSTLRHHAIWAPAVPQILQWQGPSRWRETSLRTHDIALCPPGAFPGSTPFFRLLLLCPDDIARPETSHRIENLHRLDQGRNAAIIFLVDEDVTKGATLAFTKLQIELSPPSLTLPIPPLTTNQHPPSLPLVPLHTALALPETLQTFQNSLVHSRANRSRPNPGDIAEDLIPHCAVGAPLTDRTTDVLINSCHSVKGVVEALAEEGGEDLLVEALGGDEIEAGRVVSFWRHEFGL